MTHIITFGTNTKAQIKHIRIHAEVIFTDNAIYKNAKLNLIKEDLEAVIKGYYSDCDSMIYSDAEYNEITETKIELI